jgi:hypothetical protein
MKYVLRNVFCLCIIGALISGGIGFLIWGAHGFWLSLAGAFLVFAAEHIDPFHRYRRGIWHAKADTGDVRIGVLIIDETQDHYQIRCPWWFRLKYFPSGGHWNLVRKHFVTVLN